MPDVAAWSFLRRFALLFAGAFLVIEGTPNLLEIVPVLGSAVAELIKGGWNLVVPTIGRVVFGIPEITILPNGSGDTTWNYVQLFASVVLSLAIGLAVALANPRRIDHRLLHGWLIVFVRYVLAMTMCGYGLAKLFGGQFSPTDLADLVTRYGDMSPMGVLWRFMGFSEGYLWFTGGAEILAGALLLWRRTAMLGALVAFAVMSNVVMLNLCYDIPVKLFSSELALMSLFVLSRDLGRLLDFFVLQRTPAPADPGPPLTRRWLRIARAVLKVYIALMLVFMSLQMRAMGQEFGPAASPPLYGLYRVETFTLDGQTLPPLTTDPVRWQWFVVQGPGYVVVLKMDGKRKFFPATHDGEGRTLSLTLDKDTEPLPWRYEQPADGALVLRGALPEGQVEATLTRVDPQEFELLGRGFRWVNEYPYNR